ncbi:DUF2484 family protein [Paracoccus sp. R86501]|uniref:DUF2484 family protein n=1 Tax=Paracoccus sp. R86501 TaxID=3101711 RepID=UPI0036721BC8
MTGIQLPSYPVMALAVTGMWLLAACLVPLLPDRLRSPATVVLIALGVPSLGWLTLLWGPGIGVASFALGLLALIVRPFCRRRAIAPPVIDGRQHP